MARRRANGEGTIRQRADGRWEAIVTTGYDPITGKRKRGSFYGKTQKEVRAKATQARHQLDRGTYVDPSRLTVGAWLQLWLETYAAPRVGPLTLDRYEGNVRRHLHPYLGHLALQALRAEHIARYIRDKREGGLAPSTIRQHLVVLSNALTQAEKEERVAKNVCRQVEAPAGVHTEWPTLSTVQVREQLLLAAAADRLVAAYVTLVMTGLRRGELLGLRWQDVGQDTLAVRQALLRVPIHQPGRKTALRFVTPKTPQSRRTIALTAECVQALRSHRARQAEEKLKAGPLYEEKGLVFCQADGRPIDPSSFNRAFTRALERAGLPHIRVHDGRHTYATWHLENDVNLKIVSEQLGHTSIRITADVYSHVTRTAARQAADRMSAAYRG